ncbi:M48 family metalloprotease [Myxococcus sp. RHSTA-1-4]|uniref:M48 family metalloprotease n=1 Tax=Myxococcus sp. RHSTA-1-4 TaxID=2874601 RepID=UPI001CC131E0|nr:M48 family metalloprotease [Myxococcus sp. RHSTA-1-4]MBZ4423004.1 M48 family metalloprotease [Myxococcus sp. RHSTA-1-4]
MDARLKVFAVLGLGVLASSCRGMDLNTIARGVTTAGGVAETVGGGVAKVKECGKLDVEPSVAEEYALGGALTIHFVQRGNGLMFATEGDKKLHDYLNIVGKNLAAQSLRPTLEWTFGVLNDTEQFNALSAPGGYVLVTRRLLMELDNEGQLAGVLAHEIAHGVLKHAIHKYTAQKVKTCRLVAGGETLLSALGAKALLAALDGDGTLDLDNEPELLAHLAEKTVNSFDDGNGPELEFEADQMAARLMLSAGYDPKDYLGLIDKMTDVKNQKNHPKKETRKKKLVAYLETLKGDEGEFPEYASEGLRSPPLKQPDYAVIKSTTGVAKDTP